MSTPNPLYVPELLLYLSPFLFTLDLVCLKKTQKYFNLYFTQGFLFEHLKKDIKKNQRAAYNFFVRQCDFPKLQSFFTTPSLNKNLTQFDRNEGVKMFCSPCGVVGCLPKVQWMQDYGCLDITHGRNLLLRHAIKAGEIELVDYLINSGADPLLFNAYAMEWLTLYGNREITSLILQDGVESDVETTLMIAVAKDRTYSFSLIYNTFDFLQDLETRLQIFNKALENQSVGILEILLYNGIYDGNRIPVPITHATLALTTAVQMDHNRICKMLIRYTMIQCHNNPIIHRHFADIFENVREAFFWAIFKQRWSLKNILLQFLEDLAEVGFAYEHLNQRHDLLDGQRDLKAPVDYLFLLCTLVHKPGRNNQPYRIFQELNMEFPFANCLLAKERETLMWFCLHQGQLRFFDLCIQPLRGNCRTISQPFRVPVTFDTIYSSFLAMETRPYYNSLAILHFKDSSSTTPKQPPTARMFQKTRAVDYEAFRDSVQKMITSCPEPLQESINKMWKNFLIFLEWKVEGSCKFKELEKKLPNVVDWEFCEGVNIYVE